MIDFSVDERAVARVTLNRPEVRNALNPDLIAAATQTFRALPQEVRVVVLGGAGRVFCAGADLGWMRTVPPEGAGPGMRRLGELLATVDASPAPVVARVQGAAIAGAVGLISACDVVVAASDAVFGLSEVRLGLVPAVISPWVVRKVGYSFARATFLTGERFGAERALAAGLVHRVVDPDALDAAVDETVDALLAGSPRSLAETKRVVSAVHGRDPSEVAELAAAASAAARESDDGLEGTASFFEKRPPRWVKPPPARFE